MTTSVFFTNLLWVLLLANWVIEWNWREKFSNFKQNHLLQAFLVLGIVHLLWLIGTENLSYGLFDMQKKLPLIAIPLVVLTSRPFSRKELLPVGFAYVTTIFVMSIVGLVRYLTIPDLPYRNIVPHISHIRFGLNICLTLVLLTYVAIKHRRLWLYITTTILSLWFIAFLLLLHAYTSFIILLVTAVVLLIAYRKRMPRTLRTVSTITVSAIILFTIALTCLYYHDYYHLRQLSTQPLPSCTVNGNPYLHLDDRLIENGNYVHRYVCEKEMRQDWPKYSTHPFDSVTPTGFTIYPALLRYLNGMGLTKDSLGMTHLQPCDIAAIEKGIANPIYIQHGPRKMFYVLFYEYENYRCYRSVSNFSFLQRVELWRNAAHLFLEHPLFGVGTGDVVDQCHRRLEEIHSPLADTDLHTHNQYLNFLLAFGLIGFLLIAFFFIRAIILNRYCRQALFTAFLCILLISFISEDTLETLAGIMFTVMGFSLLTHSYINESTN